MHIWTNRPIWPQGFRRPARWEEGLRPGWYQQWNRGAILSMTADVMDAGYPAPVGMNWNLYLGPTPKEVPYHPVYHPFNWRGWVDFGVSALGDMGAHLVDHPYWALGLTYPTAIEATSTPWGGPEDDPASYPALHAGPLRVPGPERHAPRRHALVRRRPHAPTPPGRCPTTLS